MADTLFKWFLFSSDKKPLYEEGGAVLKGDENTLKKPDGSAAKLKYSPDGWNDALVKFTRNTKYLGTFRDFTVPMKFVKDGARIIREYLFSVGFESVLYIALNKIDRSEVYPHYKSWYLGELDLSKASWTRTQVTAQAVEGGPLKYLKANESTKYEIDIESDPERVAVYMDGFPFTNRVEYSVYDQKYFIGTTTKEFDLGVGITSQEGTSQGVIVQDQGGGQETIAPPGNLYFIKSFSKNITAKINGKFNIFFRGAGSYQLKIHRYAADGTNTAFMIENAISGTGQLSVNYSQDIDLVPGDSLNITLAMTSASFQSVYISGSSFNVEYEVTFTPTITYGLPVRALFKRITEKLTDGMYGTYSEFLDGLPTLIYTSGMALRGQPSPKIKISMMDFFQSLRQFSVGLDKDVNNNITIEKIEKFFRQQVMFDIGEVDDLEIVPAEPYIFNTIKTGYPNQTYDKVNGQDEFNVTQNWQNYIKRISKELDLSSPARADMTGIELTRIEYYGKKTTDSSSDNDTFMLDCIKGGTFEFYSGTFQVESSNRIVVPGVLPSLTGGTFTITGGTLAGIYTVSNTSYLIDGFTTYFVNETVSPEQYFGTFSYQSNDLWRLNRPAYDSITGLLHPEGAFNVELSPKRALTRNYPFIHSFIEDDGTSLVLTSQDKNSQLSTELNGEVITENESVPVGSMPDKLFLPYFLKFTGEVPDNFAYEVNRDPYGEIAFTYRGIRFYGFLEDVGVRPQQIDKAKFTLLASPKCDLTKLQNDI